MKRSTDRGGTFSGAPGRKSAPAKDVDAYLARVPEPARSTLETVRRAIRAAAPEATEAISYGIPVFRHFGMLVGYGAAAKHCALYVGTWLRSYSKELKAYDTSKGTIRFAPDAPPPAALVRKIVLARVAQNEARARLKSAGARPGVRRP
jgi:uncharacterized protein YdhG (YjbR/CyaY superfamily)